MQISITFQIFLKKRLGVPRPSTEKSLAYEMPMIVRIAQENDGWEHSL